MALAKRGTLVLGALVLVPRIAIADTHVAVAAGGGLGPLSVSVDLANGTVVANGVTVKVELDRSLLPAPSDVVVEDVPIGDGKHVAHVRIPEKDAGADGRAWEAILAAGESAPIFAEVTGWVHGDPGERWGPAVRILPQGATSVVLTGTLHEDLNICGRTDTLLDPQALYPTLKLQGATPRWPWRLSATQIQGAQPITAVDAGPALATPLARLLQARGSSVPKSLGTELTDGDPETVWTEQRPGMGQGEFVLMLAPKEAPITRMQIVVMPPKPGNAAAAPKELYLVTNTDTFAVTMPPAAPNKPGEAYEIVFPTPLQTSCLTLVLGDAYTPGQTHPDVGVAELVAYSEFDQPGATLDDVAKRLSGDRGDAAKAVLERAGQSALAAVEKAYEQLDRQGRARAIDVAASHNQCDEAAPLLARGLCEKQGEAPRKARLKLERCKAAAPVLAKKLREDASTRACVASTLVYLAHDEALAPIADAMESTPEDDHATREALRTAFSQALGLAESPEEGAKKLGALLQDVQRSVAARLEMMRAAGPRVVGARAAAAASLDALLKDTPPMRLRFLALGPLSELAHAGDGDAAKRIAESIVHDPEWPVRRLAAKLAAGLAEARASLLAAARDPEPRVREEALEALATPFVPGAEAPAAVALQSDGWTFVREHAVQVLEKAPPASKVVDEALSQALRDQAWQVRAGALIALAVRRTANVGPSIRERLDDKREHAEVRAAAAWALGAVCDASSDDRLTELARQLGAPGVPADEQLVALGAIQGLAALQPKDLRARIGPLLGPQSPPEVKQAAQKALAMRGACSR